MWWYLVRLLSIFSLQRQDCSQNSQIFKENDHNIYIMADCQTDSDIGMIIIAVVHTFFQAFIPALTRL